jgi:glycosyltransferase involved in cell wall biosynthesis
MCKGSYWIISKYSTPQKYPRHFGIGKALCRAGANTTLICSVSNSLAPDDVPRFRGWKKIEDHEGLKVIWLNGPKLTKNGVLRILSWFLFEIKVVITMWRVKEKPQAILSSSLSLLSVFSGILLSIRHGARFSFEVRDIWPLSLIELSGISPKNLFVRFLSFAERLGYRKANTIVGTMPNLKEHVAHINKAWEDKVICVPQGLDEPIFNELAKPLDPAFISEHIPKNKFIIAYTGTLNPNNPIDTLIEAAMELESKHSEIHFLILGNGSNKEKYQTMVGDRENIGFPPSIAKNQMASFLSFVDVGEEAVSKGVGRFGLSRNKWIDYMYNRCIIICSNDGYQSMINDANSGYFVPFGDVTELKNKILQVSNQNGDEVNAMKNRGRSYIQENHSFDILAAKFVTHL